MEGCPLRGWARARCGRMRTRTRSGEAEGLEGGAAGTAPHEREESTNRNTCWSRRAPRSAGSYYFADSVHARTEKRGACVVRKEMKQSTFLSAAFFHSTFEIERYIGHDFYVWPLIFVLYLSPSTLTARSQTVQTQRPTRGGLRPEFRLLSTTPRTTARACFSHPCARGLYF